MAIAAQCIHGIKVCAIPHPVNQYRPLALRHKPLAFVSAILVVIKLMTVGVIGLTPSYAELSTITANRILQLTNAERVQAGLSPLSANAALTKAAQDKAQNMLDEDYFAHISPTGVTPWFWMAKYDYDYTIAGENLAVDFTEAEDIVRAWLASPSHKANMLHREYTQTGIAVATGEFQGNTSTVVVHMFGKPAEASVAAEIIETLPEQEPQQTAAPQETPAPSQTPVPPPADTTPPAAPRIALTEPTHVIRDTITLAAEGEKGSTLHLLLNNQDRSRYIIPLSGTIELHIPVGEYEDGELTIRAYSKDGTGNQSKLSEPIVVTKDSQGPVIAKERMQYILDPAFDSARVALVPPQGEFYAFSTEQNGSTSKQSLTRYLTASALTSMDIVLSDEHGNATTLDDVHVAPQFSSDVEQYELDTPQRLSQLYRRITAGVMLALLILLILAVFIQIRIQHPSLIGHTSFVIILAGVLLLM